MRINGLWWWFPSHRKGNEILQCKVIINSKASPTLEGKINKNTNDYKQCGSTTTTKLPALLQRRMKN